MSTMLIKISTSRLTLWYILCSIKIMWYWWMNRLRDNWNRIKSPQNDPHKCTQLIFLIFFNWSIFALQCCVSFCCTATWISYMYTYILFFLSLSPPTPPHSTPLVVNWSLTKKQRQYNRTKTVFSTNSAATTEHPNAQNRSENTYYTLHKNYLNWPKGKMLNQETQRIT